MALLNSPSSQQSGDIVSPKEAWTIRFCPGWLRTIWTGALILLAFLSQAGHCAQYPTPQVKAVFLFNFAQFVDWPPDVFENATSPMVIGVVGERDDMIASALDQVVKSEKIKNRPFKVARFPDVRSAVGCHILYLASGVTPSSRIFAELQGKSILTVGESEDILRNGGIIRFVTGRKIGLRINLKAAKSSRLMISSKLLRLAEVVD